SYHTSSNYRGGTTTRSRGCGQPAYEDEPKAVRHRKSIGRGSTREIARVGPSTIPNNSNNYSSSYNSHYSNTSPGSSFSNRCLNFSSNYNNSIARSQLEHGSYDERN